MQGVISYVEQWQYSGFWTKKLSQLQFLRFYEKKCSIRKGLIKCLGNLNNAKTFSEFLENGKNKNYSF